MSRLRIVLVAFAWLLLLPGLAHACPVCFDASEETRGAFLATTAFLSILPLGMLAGTGAWLRKLAKRADQEERSEEPQVRD
jgi:hypothetical protein